MTAQIFGNFTLNLSTFLYVVLYFPQLIHNKKRERLVNLSLHFHTCLMVYYTTDLIYGIGLGMPWQYILVSVVCTFCVILQHQQLWSLYRDNSYFMVSSCGLFLLLAMIPIAISHLLPSKFFILIGYVSQAVGLFYVLPQIFKNFGIATAALSLNIGYLVLRLVSSLCDNVSAWALHWPAPSKFGVIVALATGSVLLGQWCYSKRLLAHR